VVGAPACGDGNLDAGEECDDDNTAALDGCDASCLTEDVAVDSNGSDLATPIAPPGDPFGAAVETPSSGSLEIVETSVTESAPAGTVFLERQIHVETPNGSPRNPIVLTFAVDDAVLPSSGAWANLDAFRNGDRVPPCTGPAGRASPNPCLDEREQRAGGGAVLTVLSSRDGEWNFAAGAGGGSTSTTTTSTSTSSTSATFDPSSTTTTTVDPSGTTTTTLPPTERCLGGSTLRLTDNPLKPNKRGLLVESRDMPELLVEDEARYMPAFVEQGGVLRISADGGDGFDLAYPLEPEFWRLIDPKQPSKGVRYRNPDGPIRSVRIVNGRSLRISGKGPALGHGLTLEPELVRVMLRVGPYRYFIEFGGQQQTFKTTRSLVRRRSLRPERCRFR
jgi:cysteine-rich repeat protein